MILDTLASAAQYNGTHPGFAAAFDFLRNTDLASLAAGRHEVDGARLYAMVIRQPGRGHEGAKVETHRNYIDIQFVADGVDDMGWLPAAACTQPAGDYNPEKDVALFTDMPPTWFAVPAGSFAIFFPDDAHAPMGGQGEQFKVVMKVAVNW